MALGGVVVHKFVCVAVLVWNLWMVLLVSREVEGAVYPCTPALNDINHCLTYLRGGPGPNFMCCTLAKQLVKLCKTPKDRKGICQCLKSASLGFDAKRAAQLPAACGFSLPFVIGPNTDCSKVNYRNSYMGFTQAIDVE